MSAPKSVIAGVDGRESCAAAVRATIDLARRLKCPFELVHVVHVPGPEHGPEFGMIQPTELESTEARILQEAAERLVAKFQPIFDAESAEPRDAKQALQVLPGTTAKVLIERAEKRGADLIVLGPHERHGIVDFGNTARAVLAHAPCNVWVQPDEYRPPERILVPTDLSEHSLRALQVARALAGKLGASVTAVHCFVPPEIGYAPGISYPVPGPTYVVEEVRDAAREEFEKSMRELDWGGVEHETRFVEGHPLPLLIEMQEEFDLIALGSHGRTGLSRAVLGNVAYGVLKEARKPVLAIRHPEREWLV